MLLLGRKSAGERVATFLLEMAQRLARSTCAGSDAVEQFDLPLSRQQMADLLGITIETVSRQLTKLKIAGIIALPGVRSVTIRDEAALRAAAA